MVQRVVISNYNDDDDDDDVEFLKQTPLHPQMSGEETFKNITKRKLIQGSKDQSKEIEYLKNVPLHPRKCLKRKNRLKDEPELKCLKTVPSHPRDRLSRRLKIAPGNIVCDEEFLKEFPYFNKKIRVSETDKIKRRETIFDKILKQMGPETHEYYVKYNQDLGRYYIGKNEKVIVIESSDEEVEPRRKRKRKSTTNMDEINKIPKKQIKGKRVIYPTGTLLALKKIKTEPKQKKNTKTKVKIEGDVPSIAPERKKKRKRKLMTMK